METDDQILIEYYNENKEQFKDLYNTAHILVKTEEDANKVLNELKEDNNFSEIAKKYSICPSSKDGGVLGFFPRGLFVKEYEDAAYNLKGINDMIGPIKSQFGYHIIKLVDMKDGYIPFDEVRTTIEMIVANKK